MTVIVLDNATVEELLDIGACIDAIEEAYVDLAHGDAAQFPPDGRMDLTAPSPGPELDRRFTWGAMAGVLPRRGIFALRQKYDIHFRRSHEDGRLTLEKYCREPGTYCGFVTLASITDATPVAILNDGVLQHARVAATAAVAARHLARADARVLAIVGSGGMARSHAEAMMHVRPIDEIVVFSPTEGNRMRFAEEIGSRLGIEVRTVASAAEAIEVGDIVAFCTNSASSVVAPQQRVRPGTHISCVVPGEVGHLPELADHVVLHLNGGIVEQRAAASSLDIPTGMDAVTDAATPTAWKRPGLATLAELVAGQAPARNRSDQITYFHNVPGSGIQFAAVCALLYEAATAAGAGRQLDTELFLQDIRN